MHTLFTGGVEIQRFGQMVHRCLCAEMLRSPGPTPADAVVERFRLEQAEAGTKEENHGIADALIPLESFVSPFLF